MFKGCVKGLFIRVVLKMLFVRVVFKRLCVRVVLKGWFEELFKRVGLKGCVTRLCYNAV